MIENTSNDDILEILQNAYNSVMEITESTQGLRNAIQTLNLVSIPLIRLIQGFLTYDPWPACLILFIMIIINRLTVDTLFRIFN